MNSNTSHNGDIQLNHEIFHVGPQDNSPKEQLSNVQAPPSFKCDAHEFVPMEPESLEAAHLKETQLEEFVLKTLLHFDAISGRGIAEQLKLPFVMVDEMLSKLRRQLLVSPKASAPASDYEYESTQAGFERARRFNEQCTYFGAAPVSLEDYIDGVKAQTVRNLRPRFDDTRKALGDLTLTTEFVSQLGQAVNTGRGVFLYGPPGNGKSSIAERLMRCASEAIWIPRTIAIGREIIRLYDETVHQELPLKSDGKLLNSSKIDRRWVRIRRPTVVVGGELTLDHLEIQHNTFTGVCEAPLQMKSNCGSLVVDDLGRQRCGVTELLNRWIVPLEKSVDYIRLPSGRVVQIPFDQLLIFATNLEPNDLVDWAFLRRIPYKIEVSDPTPAQFAELFDREAPEYMFQAKPAVTRYLLEKHFVAKGRELRYCYVRDILEQARNICEFHERPTELAEDLIDVAVNNYFAGL